jgi:hypothetical protein
MRRWNGSAQGLPVRVSVWLLFALAGYRGFGCPA